MTIIQLSKNQIDEALDVFRSAYKAMDVPASEEDCFLQELKASFDPQQVYTIDFFYIELDKKIVSFAGLANSNYYEQSWELRWGTTHPEYQNQGLMGQLIQHRINLAKQRSKTSPGIIHVAARKPSIYLQHGFEPLFTRGPYNKSTYMIKYINQNYNFKETERP